MAATLQEILLSPEAQPKVLTDCETLIEQEISDKSGVSGAAVKLAHKDGDKLRPWVLPRHAAANAARDGGEA